MLPETEIGKNIRSLRKSKKMTLDHLAEKSGISKGYLSKVENSDKAPPVSTLMNIAGGLSVTISEIFGETSNGAPSLTLVRKDKRPIMALDRTRFGYSYQPLAHNFSKKHMNPYILTIPEGIEKTPLFSHPGEEMFIVMKGKVRFIHAEKEYFLEEGDTIYFDSGLPHRGFAIGQDEAICLIVIYKPNND